MKSISKFWSESIFRFYFQNFLWNAWFWLKAEKVYKSIHYRIKIEDFIVDEAMVMHYSFKDVVKKRFVGYMFNNSIYYDNPGMSINSLQLWKKIRKRGSF